jgi:hypothetical protein
MGAMMRGSKIAAIAADRDAWTKKAFTACRESAKDLISGETPPINPSLKLERLADSEWGWIVSSVVWAWVSTRAQQAAVEGLDGERLTRSTGLAPDPWLEGAIAAILPWLADACPDAPWGSPVGAWPKDDVVAFLRVAFDLITRATAARDATKGRLAGHPDVVAREINRAAGNPLMTVSELPALDDV